MTKGLHRYYGAQHLHFITCSCYRRQAFLNTGKRRDLFLKILEEARRKYRFVVHGYVLMPEHFHLLITEPERGDPSAPSISGKVPAPMEEVPLEYCPFEERARDLGRQPSTASTGRRGLAWADSLG